MWCGERWRSSWLVASDVGDREVMVAIERFVTFMWSCDG